MRRFPFLATLILLNMVFAGVSFGQTPTENSTAPATVSRLEARVAQLEKRLAVLEAQLARVAGMRPDVVSAQPVFDTRLGTLNAARAERAVALALSAKLQPGATVRVLGIQADLQGNAATADLTFVASPTSGVDARGKATFAHYTDGRWVLTHIEMNALNGAPMMGFNGSLEVK